MNNCKHTVDYHITGDDFMCTFCGVAIMPNSWKLKGTQSVNIKALRKEPSDVKIKAGPYSFETIPGRDGIWIENDEGEGMQISVAEIEKFFKENL